MTLEEIQNEIIEEFELFDDWMDKYQHLIDFSKNLDEMDENDKTEKNLINGCQSRVWLAAKFNNGKVIFTADSDAVITKGIAALLIKVLNNRTPEEISDSDLFFIDRIGLKEHLSPTRSNGLVSMVKQMKMYALAYKTIKNNK